MNRFVAGVGVSAASARHKRSADLMRSDTYYTDLGRSLGIGPPEG